MKYYFDRWQHSAVQDLLPPRGSRYANSALETREALKSYLNSDQGAVSWQWDYVRSRGPIREHDNRQQ